MKLGKTRNGMAYTSFALMASSVLLLVATLPYQGFTTDAANDAALISEASFFTERVLDDERRAHDIAFDRTLGEATSYVINSRDPLENPDSQLASIMLNASVENNELEFMKNASMNNWFGRVKNLSRSTGYKLDVRFVNTEFSKISNFRMQSTLTTFISLKDTRTRAMFNESQTTTVSSSITGLEDPMLRMQTNDFYGHFFSRCGFSDPAALLETGLQDSGSTIHGRSAVEPVVADVDSPGERIIVSENISQYPEADVQQFAAAVSAEPVSNPSNFNNRYVFDTGSVASIQDNESLIIDDAEVWRSGFREMLRTGCYIVSDGPLNGPDFLDRLANNLTGSRPTGLESLINETAAPDQAGESSNVDYVYFNDSSAYGTLNQINGVTSGDGNAQYFDYFRIDQYHVDQWGIAGLTD